MDIRQILGIKELYELHEKIQHVIFDDEQKNIWFDSIVNQVDLDTDFIRDIFQEEAAARKQLKQDYTPDSICKLFAELTGHTKEIYDECAGCGSLTIAQDTEEVTCVEISRNALPLLLFNLSIRNIPGHVVRGDVLQRRTFKVYELQKGKKYSTIKEKKAVASRQYKTIISNPPYSLSWDGIRDERCREFGSPPKSKADYMFALDMLDKLEQNGECFILYPHGVLFRGSKELEIRRNLLEGGLIKGLIGLPGNMFMNTSIPTVILHLAKKRNTERVMILDATDFAEKQNKINVLPDKDIKEIVSMYRNQSTLEGICRPVPLSEIAKNDYNLNIPRYINRFKPEPVPDIRELVRDICQTSQEIRQTERVLAAQMKELTGDNYQEDIRELIRLWS